MEFPEGRIDKAEAQPSTSSSTACILDANPSNTEEMDSIATKITEMDESILSYFKGNRKYSCCLNHFFLFHFYFL